MVWCTYCGQAFTRAEHLDRHVLSHTNIKPFKCTTCHFSFKRRDLLQRHLTLVHKEAEEYPSSQDNGTIERRLIACVACARAKTKCDKSIPSCTRCTSKGLVCEARSTKRSNDAAYRLARRQLSSYQRPITSASAQRTSGIPGSSGTSASPPFRSLVPETSIMFSPLPTDVPMQMPHPTMLNLTPSSTAEMLQMTPQVHLTSLMSNELDFLSTSDSSDTKTPAFCTPSAQRYSHIQFHSANTHLSFCADSMYTDNMEITRIDSLTSAGLDFPYHSGLDYLPSVEYTLSVAGQEYDYRFARPDQL